MMSRLWAVEQLGGKAGASTDASVAALTHALESDGFYGVRAAAAASLGRIGTDRAKDALLSALEQRDSRVRTAAIAALGKFLQEHEVYVALVKTLHNDPSYAAEAAAAREVGRSHVAQAFEVLRDEAATKPEVHVMIATLKGLSATTDPRAAAIMLAQARPGVADQIRLSALAGLAGLREAIERDHAQELIEVVRAALHDPFLRMRQAGERLVGAFALVQFQPEIEAEAQGAPTISEREMAQKVLQELQRSSQH